MKDGSRRSSSERPTLPVLTSRRARVSESAAVHADDHRHGVGGRGGHDRVEQLVGAQQPTPGRRLQTKPSHSARPKPNTWELITTYNNFYEFDSGGRTGTRNGPKLQAPEPWTVAVQGECAKTEKMNLERCFEGSRSRSASIAFAASRRGRW